MIDEIKVPWASDKQIERNEAMSAKEGQTSICHFCQRAIVPGGLMVHMTTNNTLTTQDEHPDSQGYFEVGPECAKKVPKRFIFKE